MAKTYVICEGCHKMNRVLVDRSQTPVCGSCKKPLPIHGAVTEVSDATFREFVAKSPLPLVLDVWAPWCGPCRAFAPTFEEFAQKFSGQMVFAKLNSELNQQTSAQLGIRGIPTLLVFKDGNEISRQAGAIPREHFGGWLSQFF